MGFFLALTPILAILFFLIILKWNGAVSGAASLAIGLIIGLYYFGVNWEVLWVSQFKGILIAIYVIYILWPSLLLYKIVELTGGIKALSTLLENLIPDRGLLIISLAWCFSAVLEGIAGFGLPIAITAPILISLGVAPITAIASVAVGHCWSITFGDMGIIFQTLISIVKLDPMQLIPYTAFFIGIACIGCGLACSRILGQHNKWPTVILIGLVMSVVQYLFAVFHLAQLAGLFAGFSGLLTSVILSKTRLTTAMEQVKHSKGLTSVVIGYGTITILMISITVIEPVYRVLHAFVWQEQFPQVVTNTGYVTPAGGGQAFHLFIHPGTTILIIAILCILLFLKFNWLKPAQIHETLFSTFKSSIPASLGVLTTICLSTLMEHSGMTMLLAKVSSSMLGSFFPIISPWIGILGAFATGSNNSSNILFAQLQKSVSEILSINPFILISTQTTGGALGSMLSPAKIIVGSSTVGINGQEGRIIQKTIGYGLMVGLLVGLVSYIITIV